MSDRSPPAKDKPKVTGYYPVRLAEPTVLSQQMSAPTALQVNDAVADERRSVLNDVLSVRT